VKQNLRTYYIIIKTSFPANVVIIVRKKDCYYSYVHKLKYCRCSWQNRPTNGKTLTHEVYSWRNGCSRFSVGLLRAATGWMNGRSRFDPRQGPRIFSSSLCVQTGSGAHPASFTMGTASPFPGDKARPKRDANHSPPSSAEVVNE
jgi:hypothetical protein